MTIAQSRLLQEAVYTRLTALLVGEGVAGIDVPVFDHVPTDPPRLHVRIDGFSVSGRGAKNNKRARHDFSVHVFDENTGDDTGSGTKEITRLQALIVNELEDWSPFTGAAAISCKSSYRAPDEDPLTQHGVSKFLSYIGE